MNNALWLATYNKKPRDRHRLKVGRGFLRGLHKKYSV